MRGTYKLFVVRKKLLKQRAIYDFTMRAVHRYYKHHYNKLLKLRGMDEAKAPSIDKIQYCYESLGKKMKNGKVGASIDLKD